MNSSSILERQAAAAAANKNRARTTVPTVAEAMSSFGLQGGVGFLAGALIALIGSAASALDPFSQYETLCRCAGFAAGGAVGGGCLAWGMTKKHAPRTAALGFALGFLLPAMLAGPAVSELLALKPAAYGVGAFIGTALTFAAGFGLAGALGATFVAPSLFWAGAIRFGLAGIAGGLVAALLPAFDLNSPDATFRHLFGFTGILLGAHLLPFAAGGFWFGRALAIEERSQRRFRREL
jgi:hypothetical protein